MAKDIICPFCQQPTSSDAKFCGDCGRQLSGPVTNTTTPNPNPNPPAGTPIVEPYPATVAPTNQPSNSTSAVPTTASSAMPTQANNLTSIPLQAPQPTAIKDKFFRLPRLARPISVALIIIFSLFTLIFAQSIFRTEKIFEDQDPPEGQTREEFVEAMRTYGIVTTSISASMVALGIACYKHPRPKNS